MAASTPTPPKTMEFFPKRRIVRPGLSLDTAQVSRLDHSPSKTMARSVRIVEVDDDARFTQTSISATEYPPNTFDSSPAPFLCNSSPSVKAAFYQSPIFDFSGDLAGFQEVVPPSSPADRSQIRDSASPKGLSKGPGKVQRTDTAASPRLPSTQQLLQELIGGLIWLHHQSTSDPSPKRERQTDVFGPSGYCAFKSGMKALQNLYKGTLPRTADAVCALVQVTLQFFSSIPGQASDRLWDQMRHDIYRWSLLIEDKPSRDPFLEAMNTLLVKWQSLQRVHSQTRMKPSISQTVRSSSVFYQRDPPFEFSGALQHGPITGSTGQCNFESFLKDSAILHICSRFLDGTHPAFGNRLS
ncbi:MAG: hypothetical protein Q9183_001885 [Haloplaca sp. 2 TL-2023]